MTGGQSSIEFLVILTAVLALATVAVGMFSSLVGAQHQAYSKVLDLANQSTQPQNASDFVPPSYAFISMPNVSHVGVPTEFYLVISSSANSSLNARVSDNQDASIAPTAYQNITVSGLTLLQFSLVPNAQGFVTVNAQVNFSGYNASLSATTYAEDQNAQNGTSSALGAYVDRLNESLAYAPAAPSNITGVTEWSHCSFDSSGNPGGMGRECGTADGWYFWTINYDCYYSSYVLTRSYCFFPEYANATVSQISAAPKFEYGLNLSFYGQGVDAYAALNSSTNSSRVLSGGMAIGNASVAQVTETAPQSYQNYLIMNSSGLRIVNQSAYSAYQQAMNNFRSMFDYYNFSNPGNMQSLDQAAAALNSAVIKLTSTTPGSIPGCSLKAYNNQSVLSCTPISPFYYYINAALSGSGRQLIQADGAAINVT